MTENQINLYPRRTAPELTDYLLGITDPDSSPTTMIIAVEKIRRRALDPWMELPTCTYVSATSFTIDGDWTALLKLGAYWSGYNASQKYGYVLSSTYDGGADKTTVNLVANTSYSLAAGAITSAKFAYSPPPDFPVWINWDATLYGATLGNGDVLSRFKIENQEVHFEFLFTLGSTSAITGNFGFYLPLTASVDIQRISVANLRDTGSANYLGFCLIQGPICYVLVNNSASTYVIAAVLSASIPHTWATSDQIWTRGSYAI